MWCQSIVDKLNILSLWNVSSKKRNESVLFVCSKIVSDAVNKIPDDAELGEKLVEICIVVLEKAVKLTKTTADDKLLETVKAALVTRD